MATKISNWKIEKIANILTKEYEQKEKKLTDKIGEFLSKTLLEKAPKDVEEFYKKYPNLCISANPFYVGGKWISVKAPFFGEENNKILDSDPAFKQCIKNYGDELENLKKKRITLKNKIICTLSKLNSYRKIEMEFPEAYKVLINEVDKNPLSKEVDACTDIEKLRAELNSNIKNK